MTTVACAPGTLQSYLWLNDNRLDVQLDDGDGVFLNAATVTATLVDAATEVVITGQTYPLTLAYVAASDGEYLGTLSKDVVVTKGQRLTLQVTAISGGVQAYWEIPVLVRVRQE